MTPDEIIYSLYYPLGLQMVAAWWMFHAERFAGGVVMHGYELLKDQSGNEDFDPIG